MAEIRLAKRCERNVSIGRKAKKAHELSLVTGAKQREVVRAPIPRSFHARMLLDHFPKGVRRLHGLRSRREIRACDEKELRRDHALTDISPGRSHRFASSSSNEPPYTIAKSAIAEGEGGLLQHRSMAAYGAPRSIA
jgi:hypothetical protein